MSSKKNEPSKTLFIISPIGSKDSSIKETMDKVRRHILDPVATDKGYKTIRADEIPRPGVITNQIIEHLMKDDLIIADLTELNPNVLYELAVRHAVFKPVILIGQIESKDIPFDLSAQRVIQYSLDPDDIDKAKKELGKQIDSIESKDFIVDSPIQKEIVIERKETVSIDSMLNEIYQIVKNQTSALREIQERQYIFEQNIMSVISPQRTLTDVSSLSEIEIQKSIARMQKNMELIRKMNIKMKQQGKKEKS